MSAASAGAVANQQLESRPPIHRPTELLTQRWLLDTMRHSTSLNAFQEETKVFRLQFVWEHPDKRPRPSSTSGGSAPAPHWGVLSPDPVYLGDHIPEPLSRPLPSIPGSATASTAELSMHSHKNERIVYRVIPH